MGNMSAGSAKAERCGDCRSGDQEAPIRNGGFDYLPRPVLLATLLSSHYRAES